MKQNYNFIFVVQLDEQIGSVYQFVNSKLTFYNLKYQIYTVLSSAKSEAYVYLAMSH